MELTQKQQEGLKIAVDRYNARKKYTIISGYAGTGKSTLVKFIVSALKVSDEDVVYTSFTGKATQVLQQKGNKNTETLHKLLFESFPRPDGSFFRRPVSIIPYKIVIVDEISMVPKSLMDQLMKYNVYIIGLGDPFQLPPINKNEDNHLLDNPHIFLDEIMRQAKESEIIQLTMKIRNGESIDNFKGKEVQILSKEELNTGMLQWADQILVATNATRKNINQQMRELYGRCGNPSDGDKVICCRNYWDIMGRNESALINGTIGYLKNSYETFFILPVYLKPDNPKIDLIKADFATETGEKFGTISIDKKLILEGEKSIDFKTSFRVGKNPKYSALLPLEFEYGYAITTHKAQGSEWEKVLVIEEKFPFDKEEHARWLYTACTRSSGKLVLVRP